MVYKEIKHQMQLDYLRTGRGRPHIEWRWWRLSDREERFRINEEARWQERLGIGSKSIFPGQHSSFDEAQITARWLLEPDFPSASKTFARIRSLIRSPRKFCKSDEIPSALILPAPPLLGSCHPAIREKSSAAARRLMSSLRRQPHKRRLALPIEFSQEFWADFRMAIHR